MNICMLTSDFLPNIGGIATHVYELCKALSDLGNKVWLFNIPNYPIKQFQGLTNVNVYTIPLRNSRSRIRKFMFARNMGTYLAKFIKGEKINVVHWHTIYPEGLICRFINQNILKVFTNHSSGYLETIQTFSGKIKLKFLLGHAHRIIATSNELAQKSELLGLNKNKIHFIPNGVDTRRFFSSSKNKLIKEKYNLNKNHLVVLCPRRIVPKNGVRYLIEAIPYIIPYFTNVRFLIVGSGLSEEENIIRQIISSKNLERYTIFTGPIRNSEMPAYYNSSDIVVLPSLIEATSIAGLEAMASGLPIVGTKTGGIPFIVDEGINGFIVPPKDSPQLASKILSLLHQRDLRIKMGIAGRKKAVTDFDWHIIARKTMQIYLK